MVIANKLKYQHGIEYYVVQNKNCDCLDIVEQSNFDKNLMIIKYSTNENKK